MKIYKIRKLRNKTIFLNICYEVQKSSKEVSIYIQDNLIITCAIRYKHSIKILDEDIRIAFSIVLNLTAANSPVVGFQKIALVVG